MTVDTKQLESDLDAAYLSLSVAITPAQRRAAFDRMRKIKAELARDPEYVKAAELRRGLRSHTLHLVK